ncbi:MAG: polymer-forming cytoskeletal protein [Pseudomonadota bacterium]|nr:cell shape determination protein CcmA [Pseudomonadales bacterium]MDY6919030.1 polymer-forming cytoskeletal protein [Pseudomonadota bacterium]
MWGKDKTKKVDFDRHAGKTTMVAKGTVIDGDVRFEGGLLVEGTIKGNVRAEEGSEALLRLSEAGRIEGEIHVPNVVINGQVNGDVHSSAHVELAAKAVVNGNVHYHLIEMVMGAAVNGSLVHNQAAQPAPDMAISLDQKPKREDKKQAAPSKMESKAVDTGLETKQSPA